MEENMSIIDIIEQLQCSCSEIESVARLFPNKEKCISILEKLEFEKLPSSPIDWRENFSLDDMRNIIHSYSNPGH